MMVPFPRLRLPLAALLLAAVIAAAFLFVPPPNANAQGDEPGFVDVELTLEVPDDYSSLLYRDLNVIVVNNGTLTAYDVVVVVKIVDPSTGSRFYEAPDVPAGSASLENNARTLRWTIPALGGLQREEVTPEVWHKEQVANPAWDNSLYVHEHFGEVTTSSFDSNPANDTSRVWSYNYNIANNRHRQAAGNYSVAVSADNASPSPGDNVNFTITATRARGYETGGRPPPIDLEVDISLTGGLTVDNTGTISYDPSTRPASVSYSSGVFTIGTLKADDPLPPYSVTLPITVPTSNPSGDEQCLTATLTGNPPPGTAPLDDNISDNVAEVCLGQSPIYTSADLEEFVSHPCVGVSSHPCDSTDDVRVRAIHTTVDPDQILGSGIPLIHVPDNSDTRKFDGDTNSVNAGDKVSWQVPVQISYRPYTTEHVRWTDVSDTFSYEMPGKESNFDKVHIRVSWGNALLSDSQRQATFLATYDPGSTPSANGPFDVTAEFEKLGTYKVNYSITATHDNNTASDTTDDVEYSDTGSYIFHVGPMEERLEVLDGQASPDVAATQKAYTILAAYNGPERTVNAQVEVTLPEGVTVDDDASEGIYSSGVWTLSGLKTREERASLGMPEEARLTLILEGDSAADATAAISMAVTTYTVCIGTVGTSKGSTLAHTTQATCVADTTNGGSWHQGPVYRTTTSTNTATIQARTGAGGVDDDAPAVQNAAGNGASVTVTWQAVETVNGLAVSHYVVERSASPWTEIASNVVGTSYVDTGVTAGETYQYRVRAVNGAGVAGPPSAPMSGTAGPGAGGGGGGGGTRVVYRDRDRDRGDDDDDYTWFAALETTRAVAENSPAGATVGSPVAADTNRGNRVTYSLAGRHAHLFDIEPDTGQILVGEGAALDYESDTRAYTVVVLADPARGSNARATVTITVTDAAETGTLALSPSGAPAVGQPLTATLEHPSGDVAAASWQWQRSADGVAWETVDSDMDGQDGQDGVVPSPLTGEGQDGGDGQDGGERSTYTPTAAAAGHRLRVIVVYREPGDDAGLALAGLVTASLPGEAVGAGGTATETEATQGAEGDGAGGAVGLMLLPATGPRVGEPLVAVLDGGGDDPAWHSWQWQRSVDGLTWNTVNSNMDGQDGQDGGEANTNIYYPTAADAGHLLRVIYTWVRAGSLEPFLVGAVTARLPGDANMDGQDAGAAAIAPVEPTAGPTPVAAAPPAMPAAAPQPTPVPTTVPTAVPQPMEAAMAGAPEEAATPVGTLLTAASVGARGLGNTAPAAAPSLPEGGGTAAGSETAASAAGGRVEPAASPPTQAGQPVRGQDRGNVLVWVVMAVFAALVVAGGLGYYGLRMRRR